MARIEYEQERKAHGYDGYAVIVNKKYWDGVPADIRAMLTQAMQDATR